MPSPNSLAALRRVPTPLLIVGGLHLVVVWALLNGLQIHSPLHAPHDLIGDIIDRPIPPPEKSPPLVFLPDEIIFTDPGLPVPVIDVAPFDNPVTLDDGQPPLTQRKDFGSGTAEPEPTISSAAVDLRHPLTQPPYPMSSRRLGEEGALVVAVLVGVDGRVRDAKVSQSSGFDRLDQAALSEAKQHWHLKPAARNGTPFEQWLTLRVVFRLEGR